jgi:hypothetical protein
MANATTSEQPLPSADGIDPQTYIATVSWARAVAQSGTDVGEMSEALDCLRAVAGPADLMDELDRRIMRGFTIKLMLVGARIDAAGRSDADED